MGKRKIGPDGLVSTSDSIVKHMKNLKSSKEFRGDEESAHYLKKEGRITMTRRKKLYRKGSISFQMNKEDGWWPRCNSCIFSHLYSKENKENFFICLPLFFLISWKKV